VETRAHMTVRHVRAEAKQMTGANVIAHNEHPCRDAT